MRTIALIAGLTLSAAALPATAQSTCAPRDGPTLMDALGALFGHPACRAHAAVGTPGEASARNQAARVEQERAAPRAPGPATPPRYAAATCWEAQPSYDAGGQATYRPSRACGGV